MRRAPSLAFATMAIAVVAASVAHAQSPPRRFAVRAAHAVDVRAGVLRGETWVVVSGDTIESVASTAPAGVEVMDLGDATLLPGLIDCHTHLGTRVGTPPLERLRTNAARSAIAAVQNARATLMAGITTCRDVGGGEVFPHGDQVREFAIYIAEGMTPMQAIRTATVTAAECMDWDKVGVVERGRYADLIAVAGDPTRDVRELERVRWVMKGGRVVKDER